MLTTSLLASKLYGCIYMVVAVCWWKGRLFSLSPSVKILFIFSWDAAMYFTPFLCVFDLARQYFIFFFFVTLVWLLKLLIYVRFMDQNNKTMKKYFAHVFQSAWLALTCLTFVFYCFELVLSSSESTFFRQISIQQHVEWCFFVWSDICSLFFITTKTNEWHFNAIFNPQLGIVTFCINSWKLLGSLL